jgi:threonyl-tRNA synthetase
VQAIVLPITDKQGDYAKEVYGKLKAAGFRVELDDRSEKVNFKIREAQMAKIPYMLVVGEREAAAGQVAVRNRKLGDQGAVTLDEFMSRLTQLVASRNLTE